MNIQNKNLVEHIHALPARRAAAILVMAGLVLSAGPVLAQQKLNDLIEAELPSLIQTYRQLHENPELSYKEEKTSAFLAEQLRSFGYEVAEHVGKYEDPKRTPYGVVAVLKNGAGPTVLMRAEMDALPVKEEKTGLPYASKARAVSETGQAITVMHACGHDVHMAAFLGAAQILARLKGDWSGTIVLVGQPAEEVGAGSESLLDDGLYRRFPKPDYVFTVHDDPNFETGKLASREGYLFANAYAADIVVRGIGGHGAMPQTAKDPVVLAAQLVLALQTIVSREISPTDPAVLTIGSIHGGTKGNIIPDEVRLELSMRSLTPEVHDRMVASIERMAKYLAAAAGLPDNLAPIVTVKKKFTPAIYNDPALTKRLIGAFQRLLGPENLVEAPRVMLADDFSRYGLEGRKIPVCMFRLGASDPAQLTKSRRSGTPVPALHSAEFAPVPAPTIRTGVTAFTGAVLELLKK